jgi:lipoate-protein ligase A
LSEAHTKPEKYLNNKWLLIKDTKKNGFWNMAADEELLSFEQPVLRVYGFSPHCVTIGYGMNGQKSVDYTFCKNNNIDITRRITGGKAVFHADEVTYSLSVPVSFFNNSLINAYKKSAEALAIAYSHYGINIQSQSNIICSESPVCFLEKSHYEISYEDKKLAGFAQKKSGKKILQHCSIPLNIDFNIFGGCFGIYDQDKINNLKDKISCLFHLTGKNISFNDFSDILILSFKKAFNIEFIETSFSNEHVQRIIERVNSKYILPCWINRNKN